MTAPLHSTMGVKEDWTAKVNAKGDEIRDAKKAQAAKEQIMPLVEQLNALKAEYATAVGEPFPAPAAAAPKKKKGPAAPAKKDDGKPSKNDEKKAARKAAAAAKKAEYAAGTTTAKPKPAAGKPAAAAGAAPAAAGSSGASSSTVGGMSAAQVQAFLGSVALDKYATALGGVDGAALAGMDDAALKSAGVSFAPHRRKLLKLVSGRGGGGSAAMVAVAVAGATIAANAELLLTTVISELAAVQAQIGSTEAAAAPSSGGAAPRQAVAATGAPAVAAATAAGSAAASGVDSALAVCSHRFYISVGQMVEAQRTPGGPWEAAKVSGPPKDDLGSWQLKGDGEGEGSDWKAMVAFTSIRPRRKFAVAKAGGGGGSGVPADWRAKLPAMKGVPRLQLLPGVKPAGSGAAGAAVTALNTELDVLETRILKLETKKKRGGK